MSRSGYTDGCDFDPLAHGRWRAQVASATRGKRGQAFFREIIDALRLRAIVEEIVTACEGCRLIGPAANQIQFQKAVKQYREHFRKEKPE